PEDAREPLGDRLGVDEDVVGQTHGQAIEPTLHWSPQIAELALTDDDRRHPRRPCRDDAQDVAVEVEAMDEPDPVGAEIESEPPYGQDKPRGLEWPSPAAPDPHASRLDSRSQRPDGAQTRQVNIPSGSIQSTGDLDELALGSADVQRVADEENSGARR